MKLLLTQLSLRLDYTDEDIQLAVVGRLQIPADTPLSCRIVRRSIDARGRHRRVCFSANVEAEIDPATADALAEKLQSRAGVEVLDESQPTTVEAASPAFAAEHAPVVVGAGPAGLLAAWRLARAGAKPVLIERGKPADQRRVSASEFWDSGVLDCEDNVLFGEGGAGLFSDGKLVTRSKNTSSVRDVLELLVQCGAGDSILVDAEAHIGSDLLGSVVVRLRKKIEELGGQVRFGARLESLEVDDAGRLAAVVVNGQRIATGHCILATGHSARDVYYMLHQQEVPLEAKPFAVGVRLEMPQSQIDRSQFGNFAGHSRLGAASFRLTRRGSATSRACYSFCMCPGGSVIACASSQGHLTTNGMSMSGRSGEYGCAAMLVPVTADDFGGDTDPLAGLRWQEAIEAKAFQAGGSDYSLPACRLTDFLAGRTPASLQEDRSCPRAVPADLREVLPPYVVQALASNIKPMLRKLESVRVGDVLVYAAETRSSSVVRIMRDESMQSPGVRGLYPVGEGSGYAGGIMTSAVDGLRAAESVLQTGGEN